MTDKLAYNELERNIKQLEREVHEYARKEKEFNEKRKLLEYSHFRRTISLMQIIDELEREIKERTCADEKELGKVTNRLRERTKELRCLYDISQLGSISDYSMDSILQAVVDFIPPAFQYPEITCSRIIFDRHEFTTKNFKDTKWKLTHDITVNNEQIGILEVCYIKEKPALDKGPFLNEAKSLIGAISEIIAKIVEREWAEEEIRKHRNKVEKLIKNNRRIISEKLTNKNSQKTIGSPEET